MLCYIYGKYYLLDEGDLKMSILANVQLSVFCNSRIEPLPETITALMTELNSIGEYVFIPSVITGQNIDLNSKQLKTVSNLTFVSTNQLCQIVCMDNRLDVTVNSSPEGTEIDFNESLVLSKRAMQIILNKYKIFGNRLALNVNILSNPYVGPFQDSTYGKRLYIPLGYYHDKEVIEWSTRANSRMPLTIGQFDEKLNVISELTTIEEPGSGNRRILCHMDINTLAESAGYRFTSEDLETFLSGASEIVLSIRTNIEGLDND